MIGSLYSENSTHLYFMKRTSVLLVLCLLALANSYVKVYTVNNVLYWTKDLGRQTGCDDKTGA